RVLDDINSGAAEAALGGIWVPAMYHGRVRNYVVFAQLNARFPMALLTRTAPEPFAWQSLEGKVVLVPGAGGAAPYLFFAGLLRESGIDVAGIRFVHDLSGDMLASLFAGGMGDALVIDMMTASILVQRG